jgi:hypothetical protein
MSARCEPAREELIRAEAAVERAIAKSVERLLVCIVALTGLTVVCVALGEAVLALGCLTVVGVLVRGVVRSAKGPRGRGRSSVM